MVGFEAFEIEEVHKDLIRPGDLVICSDDEVRTIGNKDIRTCSFYGTVIRGDSYTLGLCLVKRLRYNDPMKKRAAA